MAQTVNRLNHQFIPSVRIEPINPKYEARPYISGWFLGFSTEYRKDMVSCDGYEKKWYCSKCGLEERHELHDMQIRKDSY